MPRKSKVRAIVWIKPMQLLGAALEAGMRYEERPLDARFIDAMKVPGKDCTFVRDFYGQDGRIVESTAGLVSLDGVLVSAAALAPWLLAPKARLASYQN